MGIFDLFRKKQVDIVSAQLKETAALADPLIYTDDELEDVLIALLESKYFEPVAVFTDYLNNPENRAVSRPFVENEIRSQHPDDRAFWSLTLNPFLERF